MKLNHLNKAQQKASKKLQKRVRTYGIACLWGQIRSGKSRAFLDASKGYRTLVVTKKDAINGVLSEAKEIGVDVDVINYHSVHKVDYPDEYQLIIFDECHLYISQAQPKPSTIWKKCQTISKGKFIIYSSGTPTAEGYGGIYHMLKLSSWSPFKKYTRFTLWFKDYGVPEQIYIGSRSVESYKKTQAKKIKKAIKHLVVTLTRKDAGHKHESEDIYHKIPMTKKQTKITKELDKHKVWSKKGCEIFIDSGGAKLLTKKHQIAGGIGVMCDEDVLYKFKKEPKKVEYIKKNFDVNTTIILSFYKHEQEYLSKIFPHTGSVTKLSSGVDLSHYKTMIVYSMSFSASNYEQVRGRLMNVNRKTPMFCHYLVSGIDEYVLEAVKNKENFTASWYNKKLKD